LPRTTTSRTSACALGRTPARQPGLYHEGATELLATALAPPRPTPKGSGRPGRGRVSRPGCEERWAGRRRAYDRNRRELLTRQARRTRNAANALAGPGWTVSGALRAKGRGKPETSPAGGVAPSSSASASNAAPSATTTISPAGKRGRQFWGFARLLRGGRLPPQNAEQAAVRGPRGRRAVFGRAEDSRGRRTGRCRPVNLEGCRKPGVEGPGADSREILAGLGHVSPSEPL